MSDINWGHIRSGKTFEDLVRALIFFEDHNAYLLGRNGRDDGQDVRSGDGQTVYQAKFHQDESVASAIADAKVEAEKIAKYRSSGSASQAVWENVQSWVLVSNVDFNPRDDKRWEEEVKPLFRELGLEASYWEKAEIEARLHRHPELKRAYFGGETRVFLGLSEAYEQVQQQEFHPTALQASYQGRSQELAEFKTFLDGSKRILVVHGPGGIGKTRFLLESANIHAGASGWAPFWANVSTMATTSTWFLGLVPERPLLLLLDEPQDSTVLKTLVEQMLRSQWKVAIAVRSPNDPVLHYLQGARMQQITQTLCLPALEESSAVAFCKDLIDSGVLNTQSQTWKDDAASWASKHYNQYPVWISIAIDLLERNGNLEAMPQKIEELASQYIEEVLALQKDHDSDQLLQVLRWIALLITLNTEDLYIIEFVREKTGFANLEQLQLCLNRLYQRKALRAKGARDRLLEIKPDVLSDHILRKWLTVKLAFGSGKRRISQDAIALVKDIARSQLDSSSNLTKSLLRGIARFELTQQLAGESVDLLEELIEDWQERLPHLSVSQRLALLKLLDEISFSHVESALRLVRSALSSTAEPEGMSTLFGERELTQDDVILALPNLVFHAAEYARLPSEQHSALSLLCQLVVVEEQILSHRSIGFRNDGHRAHSLLSRLIGSGGEFRSFEDVAFDQALTFLNQLHDRTILENDQLILNGLIKPLLKVERERTRFDGQMITINRWFISPDETSWSQRSALRQVIQEILEAQSHSASEAVMLWQLLDFAHSQVNQAILELARKGSASSEFLQGYSDDLQQDLHWLIRFLNSHNLDIQELSAARQIWDWHYQFDDNPILKELATQCETIFTSNSFVHDLEPLFRWDEDFNVQSQRAIEKSRILAQSGDSGVIHDFVKNAMKYLGEADQISRLFGVAGGLGEQAQSFPVVQKFVEESLKLSVTDARFQFACQVARSWIWIIRREDDQTVIPVLNQLLYWARTSERIVPLIQSVYSAAWIAPIDITEVTIIAEQVSHFANTNQLPSFVGLLGGMFFVDSVQIRSTIEAALANLEGSLIAQAVNNLLQTANYAMNNAGSAMSSEMLISFRDWILDQVLRLPDIDELEGRGDWNLNQILKHTGRPDLSWLVNAIKQRIETYGQYQGLHPRILPYQERLSKLILPLSCKSIDDVMQAQIAKLIDYYFSFPSLRYELPRYLHDIDPEGLVTAELTTQRLDDPDMRDNPEQLYYLAKLAGYYSEDSSGWRMIAHSVCSLAMQFRERDRYSIFHALQNPEAKVWMSNLGQVAPNFEQDVETVRQQLETEPDQSLVPYWQWRLRSAEMDLEHERERVKEDIIE